MQGNQDYGQHGDGPHVGPLLEAFHAGTLRAMEAEQVARHLRACAACREQSDAIAVYRLIRAAPAPAVGPELREQVYARIAAESAPATTARAVGQIALRERQDQPRAALPTAPRVARPSRGWLSGAVAVVIVALLASVFWALPRLKSGAGNSSATPAPVTRACPPGSATSLPTNGHITDIAMTSASEGWAVGGIVNGRQGMVSQALLMHVSDCRLTPYTIALPNVALRGISMGSPTDGWAIGNNQIAPVLLHYSAGVWKQVALPKQTPVAGAFDKVRMLNANEGWIIMNGVKDSHGLLRYGLLHDVNGVWSTVPCPLPVLADVAPVGPNDIWVTGGDSINPGSSVAKFAHYHDGQWTIMAQLAGAVFNSLYVVSPTDIWASGKRNVGTLLVARIARYDGATWRMSPQAVPPGDGVDEQVFALGDSTGWAFHITVTHHDFWPDTPLVTGISRETGGEWQAIDWPYNDVARVSAFAPASDGDVWVVGAVGKDVIWTVDPNSIDGYPGGGGFVGHTVLLHYANGAWTRYG